MDATKRITTIVMQNTDHVWMRQGSHEAAEVAAKDILDVIFNARTTKQIYERMNFVGDDAFLERKIESYTPQELLALIVRWLSQLEVGECFVKTNGTVRFCRTVQIENSITDEHAEEARINQPWLSTGEIGTDGFSSSSRSTPPQQNNSSRQASTPITELLQDE